jgi:dTMP kinase
MTPPTESARPGRFLVLEGIDGCGSTTQTERLVARLRARGFDARGTFEPTRGPVGGLLRAVLEHRIKGPEGDAPRPFDWTTLALLFAADRLDHLTTFVRPALAAGAVVVSDRYTLSSLVYQSVTSAGASDAIDWVRALNRNAPPADLTLVIDVPVAVALERRRLRGGPEELFDAQATQERLAAAYRRAETIAPDERVVHIDGAAAPEEVTARLDAAVVRAFPELAGDLPASTRSGIVSG